MFEIIYYVFYFSDVDMESNTHDNINEVRIRDDG